MFIQEEKYVVKVLTTESEKQKASQLRHEIFAGELKWVPERENKLEIDKYDNAHTIPFGVFFENDILAYIRFIPADYPFMIDDEFKILVDKNYKVRREKDTGETSRFCVFRKARQKLPLGHYTFMFLLKGLYHWCIGNNIRYIYTVVESKVLRLLCAKGYPCKLIGDPVVMCDGIEAAAVILDWRLFEDVNKRLRPGMFEWFSQARLCYARTLLRLPEPCLPYRASV